MAGKRYHDLLLDTLDDLERAEKQLADTPDTDPVQKKVYNLYLIN